MTAVAEQEITVGAAEKRLFHSGGRMHALPDVGEGVVEAYTSVFGVTFWEAGFFTRRKVRIGEHAFDRVLEERSSFPIVFEHDWDAGPIGHTVEQKVDGKGLRAVAQLYIDDEMGRRVWRSMEAGALEEWSIGFYPRAHEVAEDDDGDEITTYTDIDLAEMSVVFRGANPDTETITVQSAVARVDLTEAPVSVVLDGVRYRLERIDGEDQHNQGDREAAPDQDALAALLSRRAYREALLDT